MNPTPAGGGGAIPQSLMAREEKLALAREYLERAKDQEISIAEFARDAMYGLME